MTQIAIKAGQTFSLTGVVSTLATGSSWTAAAYLRDAQGARIATLTTTLVEASDYETSGDWNLTLYADPATTATWLDPTTPFGSTVLYGDVVFSAGMDGPILPSETFTVLVEPLLTAAWGGA